MIREKLTKKLHYRSTHRGCKETDMILGSFFERFASHMTLDELNGFEVILEQSDVNIYDWCVGAQELPPEFDSQIFKKLVNFSLSTISFSIAK